MGLRIIKICIALFFLININSVVHAANHYVDPAATGGATGADWTNAYTAMPPSLTRGDTYYLAEGSYGGYSFNDAQSSTDVIEVIKCGDGDGTCENAAGYTSSHHDGKASFTNSTISSPYWVIDGGGRSDWSAGYGIEFVNSSTNGKALTITNAAAPGTITLRYLEVYSTVGEGLDGSEDTIYGNNTTNDISNVVLEYCYIHDAGRNLILLDGMSYITIQYNLVARNTSSAGAHGQGVRFWGNNSTGAGGDHVVIRYNKFVDIEGTGDIVLAWGNDDIKIYGNEFYETGSHGDGPHTGLLCDISEPGEVGASSVMFNNNTVYNLESGTINAGINLYITEDNNNFAYNNIWYGNTCSGLTITGMDGHDYNYFVANSVAGPTETHGITSGSNPFTDSASYDLSLSAAISGVALDSEYNTDMDGVTRGVDGIWDRGAHEYNAGGDTTAPTVTAFTIPATSESLTVPISTFTATDAVGVTGYCVNESATPPTAESCSGSGWGGPAQTSYTFSTEGSKTLYPWAKDAAGNISDSASQYDQVEITLPDIEASNIIFSGVGVH